jgi:hypothetical protein
MDLNLIKNHIRNRPYMSGIIRERARIKETEECFTPDELVVRACNQILDEDPTAFSDPAKTFIDPTGCGDGQFLGEVLIRKLENGIDFETALSTIYGVDLMQDNVELCRERLLCGREDLRHILEQNIVCADALRYHYRFDGTPPYDKTAEEKYDEQFDSLFEA